MPFRYISLHINLKKQYIPHTASSKSSHHYECLYLYEDYVYYRINRAENHFYASIHSIQDPLCSSKLYLLNYNTSHLFKKIPNNLHDFTNYPIDSDDAIFNVTLKEKLHAFDFNGILLNKIELPNYDMSNSAFKSKEYILYGNFYII